MKMYIMKVLLIVMLLFQPCMVWAQHEKHNETTSFNDQFPSIENRINRLYENAVFYNVEDKDFDISDICTSDFLKRLSEANEYDTDSYATWLLRSGMQDGQDIPSRVISVVPGENNTVIVNWSDMGLKGSTTFTMVKSDGQWKIDNATVPDGYNPL